ncbi:MAG: MarR family transcriptional regulator [Georgfuchsia sp.]
MREKNERRNRIASAAIKAPVAQQNGSEVDIAVAEETFCNVLRLVREVQTGMQNIVGSHGLSGSQIAALWQISAEPGLRVAKLAEVLQIKPCTASNLLDKLELRGLVRRKRLAADQRVVRLYLLPAGLKLIKNIPGPMQGRLRYALRKLPVPVLNGLFDGVTSVLEIMGEQA